MKDITARVQIPAGEFILSQDPQGHLRWSTVSGTVLPSPDTGTIQLWDGCVDPKGEFHLFLHTQSRHLIHCHTADGRHWQRQSLARLDREDVRLQDLLAAALPELTLIYLLSGEGKTTAAVRYTQTSSGSWQGRRLKLPSFGTHVALLSLNSASEGIFLYTIHHTTDRSRIFRIALDTAAALEICSAPSPISQPQLLHVSTGQLHVLFIRQEEAFADGYPLIQKTDHACLYEENGQVYCACKTEDQWRLFVLSSEGWTVSETQVSGEPHLQIASGIHQFRPVQAISPTKPSPAPAVPSSPLMQTIHNQAVLLSALQESFRELQQQHFTVSARLKALEAQQKSLPALKDRCTQLEQAMESLEALFRP